MTVNQEDITIDITILNKYNKTGVAQFHKSLLLDLNTQMKINPLIVGDFHILLSTKNRSSRQKKNITTETIELIDILHQTNLADIYRIFYLKLKNTHSTQQQIEYFLK